MEAAQIRQAAWLKLFDLVPASLCVYCVLAYGRCAGPWMCALPLSRTALLGPSGKILAGGGLGQVEPAQEFSDGEPVAWHSMEERVYEEVLHSWQCKKMLDGSTLDDTFALAALKQNVVYVGVVWSEQHKEFLHQRLVKRAA